MLNVALVGLLAGSLTLGAGTGDDDKKKKSDAAETPAAEAVATPGIFDQARAAQDPEAVITDTYAFGIASDAAPIKFWVSYAWGEAESIWDASGDDAELAVAGTNGDIVSQRANVGAQINFLNLPAFKVGAGAQLTAAKNEFQVGSDGDPLAIGDLESDFALQNIKVYGTARGQVVGVHGGYLFDIGSEGETRSATLPNGATVELPTSLDNSDGRDAIFFGADFDYPSERFRLFGGLDHYMLQSIDSDGANDFDQDYSVFMFGAGLRFSVFEVGAAAQIVSRLGGPTVDNIGATADVGGHAGTVAPYIRISPPSLPASLFIKGSVQDEYNEYGYAIGGANSVQPSIGFTAGLTVGFE